MIRSGLAKNIFLLVCWVFGYQIGDEICDGIANTEACNYDDGDCCLEEINRICYGDDCICHEDGLLHPEVSCNLNLLSFSNSKISKRLIVYITDCEEKYIGDGIFDDIYNTPDCEFDGGDCCTSESDMISLSCWKCVCHNETTYTSSTPMEYETERPTVCKLDDYYMDVDYDDIGDGICDENLNHEVCNYDGGDCCFGIKGVGCWMCKCKEESMSFPIITDVPHPSKFLFALILHFFSLRFL